MVYSIPWTSLWASMQGSPGRDSCVVFLSSISAPSWRVSSLPLWATRACMTDFLSPTEDPASLRQCTAVCRQRLRTVRLGLGRTRQFRRENSNTSIPSTASQQVLHSVIEQDPSIRPRTSQFISKQIFCVRILEYCSTQTRSTTTGTRRLSASPLLISTNFAM